MWVGRVVVSFVDAVPFAVRLKWMWVGSVVVSFVSAVLFGEEDRGRARVRREKALRATPSVRLLTVTISTVVYPWYGVFALQERSFSRLMR